MDKNMLFRLRMSGLLIFLTGFAEKRFNPQPLSVATISGGFQILTRIRSSLTWGANPYHRTEGLE